MERRETLRFELASYEVMDLLVGNHIYADPPRVVVRELLQNAVDACRLRQALEPGYTPEIILSWAPGRLSVRDNGIGMTEDVVRNFFLRVGRSYYSSAEFHARYAHVAFAPIARFGIGALSAFLVADRLVVETRHGAPDAVPVGLEIEGVHSSITVRDLPAHTPVGTRLELHLRPEVAYPDLLHIVRHWARHLELPVRVETAETAAAVVPPDDGAGYRRQLLEPANFLLLDPARRHQIRTRRLQFDGDGLQGFVEYLYLHRPGHLCLPWTEGGRGLVDVYTENAPRAVSLDGIYVGDRLPCWLGGPGVAFDLNLSSQALAVQLHLNRKEFVENLPYRHLVERLDGLLADDLINLLQEARLTPIQIAESIAALVDIRRLRHHAEATGATAAWERLARLPIFPRRQGGTRAYLTWSEFEQAPEVIRIPVGQDRISFPESAAHQVDDFWWDRHYGLARDVAAAAAPSYTSLDANPVADAFLERAYAPIRICVDPVLGCSYPVYGLGAPAPMLVAGLPVLPFASAQPLAMTWALGGWVLNALYPEVAAALTCPPGSPERLSREKSWRDLARRLGVLPLAADAAAAGANLPAHDTAEWWEQEWERFLLSRGRY